MIDDTLDVPCSILMEQSPLYTVWENFGEVTMIMCSLLLFVKRKVGRIYMQLISYRRTLEAHTRNLQYRLPPVRTSGL